MFDGFRKRRTNPKLQPESRWTVRIRGDNIAVIDERGEERGLAKRDLSGILIETNDSGPWGADVWWLLFGEDDLVVCAFPQGATGEQDAIDWFTTLPGFDHRQMIVAMTSTANAAFPVWRKPAT